MVLLGPGRLDEATWPTSWPHERRRPSATGSRNYLATYILLAVSIDLARPLPITEASRRGVSRLVADAEGGQATILRRHSEPVAAVIGYQELLRLQALERDLVDVALVLARAATDDGQRTSLDEVIEGFGYTRGQLEAMDEPR